MQAKKGNSSGTTGNFIRNQKPRPQTNCHSPRNESIDEQQETYYQAYYTLSPEAGGNKVSNNNDNIANGYKSAAGYNRDSTNTSFSAY